MTREVAGLLALMLLIDARRPARTTADGAIVTLADQDRARWDATRIAEGLALLDGAIASGRVGEYQVQAAIAAIHDRAPRADDTDWPQILALYGLLEQMTGNPVITLNRAVATAMVDGPVAGLAVARWGRGSPGRALSRRRGPRAPARDGRRTRRRDRVVSTRRRSDDEPAGAALPRHAGRTAQIRGSGGTEG